MPRPSLTLAADGDVLRGAFAAVRRELEVPEELPADVLAEAHAAATSTQDPYDGERTDLRDVPFVTIDPPGSTDLDQAVHLERRGTGYRVRYAIADVAAFVRAGGAIDAEAHRRGETVYCPDGRIPLHPAELSEGAASLLAGVERLAVVWTFDLDAEGAVASTDVRRGRVRSREQLDYAGVQAQLASAGRDDLPALLAEIGTLRARQERARGGVSLGRPEQEVVPDSTGWRLEYRAPLPVEDHNAQISLLTGMAAAGLMLDAGAGILRTMPPADAEALARLRRQARALGVAWADGEEYGDVLARLDHTEPGTAAFLSAATALFRGAAWTPFDGTPPAQPLHGAIAAPYAHVTAPLRRLVDRYGLEVSLAAHAGTPVPEWVTAALPTLGEEMATAARRSSAVDRACTDVVEAAVLALHVGTVFDGVALDHDTVQLADPAVVARCDGEDLPVGERVRVRLVRADVDTREVRFTLDADVRAAEPARP
ncbi:RNB domain-containing ribonuclease [Cellulomonas cellasea]|uniref:Ribonuclease II n=2 Tax=Cellulomonas cellasea TaxID=43670 RepID=A0A0A0B8H5_9CELL|nr:RNB domain-containing ribonuclease [Cellulomonas cellasea]KGM02493.1 ribonuclease II [Cellulomonas cellasea DSM 20118]GEA88733.1 ribonuclease R [Cellulomonas cellasea]